LQPAETCRRKAGARRSFNSILPEKTIQTKAAACFSGYFPHKSNQHTSSTSKKSRPVSNSG
jgi:hypothetical protein